MSIPYSLIASESGDRTITAFIGGQVFVANHEHANFDRIVDKVASGDVSVVDLFDVSKTVQRRFERLSDRVTVSGGSIFFDGDHVDNSLTQQILRYLENDVEDWKSLVNFMERVALNPNEHSRTQLFDWLSRHDFTLTPEGYIVMYKGVEVRDGQYYSVHSGKATVDGVEYNGQIPNPIGSVVEMPRSAVVHDPGQGCSAGLHAADFSFAQSFCRQAVLELHVDPAMVVSVPSDNGYKKVRTCKYKVIREVYKKHESPYVDSYGDVFESEGCEDCGYDECYCDEINYTPPPVAKKPRPTDSNHVRQARDAHGRFIPRG